MSKFKTGDKVRVAYEGRVVGIRPNGILEVRRVPDNLVIRENDVYVERIIEFGPGAVVELTLPRFEKSPRRTRVNDISWFTDTGMLAGSKDADYIKSYKDGQLKVIFWGVGI